MYVCVGEETKTATGLEDLDSLSSPPSRSIKTNSLRQIRMMKDLVLNLRDTFTHYALIAFFS